MCSVPDGYGSISSWYQWFSSAPSPGAGFGVEKARSSSQTRCHFASICRWVVPLHRPSSSPDTKKPLDREAVGSCRGGAALLPALCKQALHSRAV